MSTITWGLVVAAGGLAYALPNILETRVSQLRKAEACRDEFYRGIKPLMLDDDTPETMIDLVGFMSATIDQPTFSQRLMISALRGNIRRAMKRPSPKTAALMQDWDNLDKRRPELLHAFSHAVANYWLASTYSSYLIGWLCRRTMFYNIDMDGKGPTIIASEQAGNRRHDPGSPAAAVGV